MNYHHLLYFWHVARAGSLAAAADILHLSQPTISAQLKRLQKDLGQPLFRRTGRSNELTAFGHTVFEYAEQIFRLGQELEGVVRGGGAARPHRFNVGIADVLPKLIAYRLIEPTLSVLNDVRLVCLEDKPEQLLARLAVHQLDVVLTDSPVPPLIHVRAFNHLLGESPVAAFAHPSLAKPLLSRFPDSLHQAPVLLPVVGTALRRNLDRWFEHRGLHPAICGEFEDSALLKAFGSSGRGVFFGPTVIESEIRRQYGVLRIGTMPELSEQFFAVSVERRLKHPAVVALSNAAHEGLLKLDGEGRL